MRRIGREDEEVGEAENENENENTNTRTNTLTVGVWVAGNGGKETKRPTLRETKHRPPLEKERGSQVEC